MKKSVAVIILMVFLFSAAFPIKTVSAAQELNVFYVVKDFYEVNWHRDWWDSLPKGIAGDAGSVDYSVLGNSMTVEYSGNYPSGNNIMWGQDNQISLKYRDFSTAAYFVNEVKNEGSGESRYQLIVSNSSEEEDNYYIKENFEYYLKDKSGSTARYYSQNGYMVLPNNFDGYAVVPVTSYPSSLYLASLTRFSFGFPRGSSGKITFRRIGSANNALIVGESEIIISDPTVYFILPERITLTKAPERKPNEPETAIENNYKED